MHATLAGLGMSVTLAGFEPAIFASEERIEGGQTSALPFQGDTIRNRTDCSEKTRPAPRSGHPVGRLVCSMALLHWSAQCCSFVIVCRRCLLQVGRDRDAHAVAFCASGGRRRWLRSLTGYPACDHIV